MTSSKVDNRIHVSGMDLQVERRGTGTPLLLIPGEEGLEFKAPFLDELAARHEVIVVSPPGFGLSERADWIGNTDDISYIYLDLVEKLDLKNVPVVGFSHGGWIAVEMAVKDDSFISKLVLVDALGVKFGGPTDRDIADIWTLASEEVLRRRWHDPEKGRRDFPAMPEDELTIIARNVESLARFCWDPYMHNPRLKHRMHRIQVPTLVLWGEHDGIVSKDYGRSYAGLIAGASFKTVPNAGHYPHLEQPAAFMTELSAFLR